STVSVVGILTSPKANLQFSSSVPRCPGFPVPRNLAILTVPRKDHDHLEWHASSHPSCVSLVRGGGQFVRIVGDDIRSYEIRRECPPGPRAPSYRDFTHYEGRL